MLRLTKHVFDNDCTIYRDMMLCTSQFDIRSNGVSAFGDKAYQTCPKADKTGNWFWLVPVGGRQSFEKQSCFTNGQISDSYCTFY